MLQQIDQSNGNTNLVVGNGETIPIACTGTTTIKLPSKSLVLKNILHTPKIKRNLISVSQLTSQNDVIVEFNADCFFMKDKSSRRVLLQGRINEGLYQLSPTATVAQAFLTEKQQSYVLNWHRKLGHPSSQVLKKSMPHLSINKTEPISCAACQMGKHHKLPFQNSVSKAKKPLKIIHTDIWGPSPVTSKNGYMFYIIFVDDHSIFCWLYPLKHKSEALQTFVQFKIMIEKQLETSI